MVKKVFKVSGMHCASCAHTIEKTVCDNPGVKSCSVNFGPEKAVVKFVSPRLNVGRVSKGVKGGW